MSCFKTVFRFSSIPLLNCNAKEVRNRFYLCFRHYRNQAGIKSTILKNKPDENILVNYFNLSATNYNSIIKSNPFLLNLHPNRMKNCLDTCLDFGIINAVILDHLSILQADHVFLQNKLNIVSKMNFTNINHGVPFLQHSSRQLVKLCSSIKKEEDQIPFKNRLYYLSEKLEVDPQILGKIVAKRLFIYEILFESLQKTMDVVLDAGIQSENIMKDIWILKYNHVTVQNRLKKFQDIGSKKLMPWMVRCTEGNMKRYIDIKLRTDELLRNDDCTQSYLANRLKCTDETVSRMVEKIPSISTINVRKVCDILDYLFSEGFSTADIIEAPRVFAHSLNTLKRRQQILKTYDANYRNLFCLCKDKKNFQGFVQKMQKK